MLKLIPTLLNNIPFASFELGQVIYRAKPIQTRQAFSLIELEKNQAYTIETSQLANYPLLLTRINIKLEDKEEKNQGGLYEVGDKVSAKIQIIVINMQSEKVEERIMIDYTDDWKLDREIILRPQFRYQIKSDTKIEKLTFVGENVYLFPEVNLNQSLFTVGSGDTELSSGSNEVSSGNTRG